MIRSQCISRRNVAAVHMRCTSPVVRTPRPIWPGLVAALRATAVPPTPRLPCNLVRCKLFAVTLLVTVDTNQLDDSRISRLTAILDLPHELAYVTVTTRERGRTAVRLAEIVETGVWGESRWGEAAWTRPIPEAWVAGESRAGEAVAGDDAHTHVFETALAIISAGSFPARGQRAEMAPGQHRQLRDAMIFEAHVRARRHLLLTDDVKGFIRGGRREELERLGQTRIRTSTELEKLAVQGDLALLTVPWTETAEARRRAADVERSRVRSFGVVTEKCPACGAQELEDITARRPATGAGEFMGQAQRIFRCGHCGELSGELPGTGDLVMQADWPEGIGL